MIDDPSDVTELPREETRSLLERAKDSAHYSTLSEFLVNVAGEPPGLDDVSGFEREDGLRVVAISETVGDAELPTAAISICFRDGGIVYASAERNDPGGPSRIAVPAEFAPDPGEAESLAPEGSDGTVDRREDLTVVTLPR